jgi:hypothetical protein
LKPHPNLERLAWSGGCHLREEFRYSVPTGLPIHSLEFRKAEYDLDRQGGPGSKSLLIGCKMKILASDHALAGGNAEKARDGLEHGRLSGPVGTHEGGDRGV